MTATKELIFPGAPEFKAKALSIVDTANGIEILDDDGFQEVGLFLQKIKTDRKELDRICDTAIEAAYLEHKSRVGLKKEYAIPLDQAERIAKDKMEEYDKKRKAEIAAEQKRLEDEARKVAEEKRQKEIAELERQAKIRREKEAEDKRLKDLEIARLKKEGDAKAAKRAETEKLMAAEKARLQAEEDKKRAAAVAAAPLKIEAVAKIEAPVAAGVTVAQVWAGELEGGEDPVARENALRALIEAVAAKKAPLYLLIESTTEIRKMAESTKGVVKVPGVRFFQKAKTTVRS